MGLPPKARIPRFRDNAVLVISGIGAYTVYSFTPQCGSEELVPVPGCSTGAFDYIDRLKRPKYGSRSRIGLTGGISGIQGHVYTITPQTDPVDQSSIQGTFMLSHLWARVLFDPGASHSFIVASCVKELGLEVETLEKPLYLSSPLGTRVKVDLICRVAS